jgi:hypothetical protein
MRRKGESCLSILKRELNIKGKASKYVIAEAEKRHAILVAQWSKKPAPVSK